MKIESLILRRIKSDTFTNGDLNRAMAQLGLKRGEQKTYRAELARSKTIKKVRGGGFECIKFLD